jgi:hypothetical protein
MNRTDKFGLAQAAAASTQSALRVRRRNGRRNAMSDDPTVSTLDLGMEDDAPRIPAPPLPAELERAPVAIEPSHTAITLSPLDLPAAQFRDGLDRRKQNRELLMDWLRTALVDGVDFGRVHVVGKERCEHAKSGRVKDCTNSYHWSKPSLFKPGAEKITGMLGMTVHYPSLPAYETALLSGTEIRTIILRCELHDAQGRVVAEGVGARSLSDDYGDLNKTLKMAEKSAHIDATLRLGGLSEVFTQDMEDRPPQDVVVAAPSAPTHTERVPPQPKPASGNGAARPASQPGNGSAQPASADTASISNVDVEAIKERMAMIGIAERRVLAWLKTVTRGAVTQFEQLNAAQCASLMKRLDLWAKEMAEQAA